DPVAFLGRAAARSTIRPVSLDLDRAADLFLDHSEGERNLAPNTIESYSRDLTRLAAFLVDRGRADVERGGAAKLTDYLLHLAEADLSPRSRARPLVAIRGWFRFLVAARYLATDPTETLEAPRLARRLPEVIGLDDVERLLA